ncbi:uncharacterized protein LOC113520349 [Galleria mellonella]|uniref:Uncharacterized protein LOC113520349 n=1 Tax=Galleria mellonella TaxID=7137 RepID=A0A6J1WXS8_GALME|nr:uncharacterized protein LOC113520349 [Galleria mellonella]XP_031770488.2 uncharacterized protein LOC113520349 [Galleria mellonella]
MNTSTRYFNLNLRIPCFIIGYINLFVSIIDVFVQVTVVFIITNGFQCDVSENSLSKINWPWMELILLVLNIGTHGFYPFPLTLRNRYNLYDGYSPIIDEPKCYPGIMHIYLVDILNFVINIIWFKFVKEYVIALHKKDPAPMRMFLVICILKLALQAIYFKTQPDFKLIRNLDSYWLIKYMDIIISALCIIIIFLYTRQIRNVTRKLLPTTNNDCLKQPYKILKEEGATDAEKCANKCSAIYIN